MGGNTTSTPLFPVANLILYAPVYLPYRIRIKNLWWFNGSAVAGNVNAGLYTQSGYKIVDTGSTAQTGINAKQSVALGSNIELVPGGYYFAFSASSVSARFVAWSGISLQLMRDHGYIEDTAAGVTLPSPFSPQQAANAYQVYQGADLV